MPDIETMVSKGASQLLSVGLKRGVHPLPSTVPGSKSRSAVVSKTSRSNAILAALLRLVEDDTAAFSVLFFIFCAKPLNGKREASTRAMLNSLQASLP